MTPDIVPKPWFEEWREPREFFRRAEDCRENIDPADYWVPEIKYLREAFVAGLFARVLDDHEPCTVRLVSDREQFPDAQIQTATGVNAYEITMAGKKDRRIGDEYREHVAARERGEPTRSIPIDKEQDRADALEAMPRVISEKVHKYFRGPSDSQMPAHLLVYLNFSTVSGFPLADQELADLSAPWAKNFQSIWVLTGARIVRAWPTPYALAAVNHPVD